MSISPIEREMKERIASLELLARELKGFWQDIESFPLRIRMQFLRGCLEDIEIDIAKLREMTKRP